MSNARNIASGAKFVDTSGDTMTGNLGIGIGSDAAQGTLDVRGAIVTSNSTTSYWKLDRDDSTGSFTINDTGANNRMLIDTIGRVTMPYQPSFRASNGVTTFSGAGTSFACSTVHHNIGSHYNTNGTFTAPVSAVYHFNYSVTPLGGGVASNGSTSFRLNGTSFAQILDYSAADSSTQSITVYMAANDTMEAIGRGANNGSWTSWSASQTTFSGHMVG